MLKLYINESYILDEAIEDIKKYYPNIPDDIFMQLIQLDPTYRGNDSAGKYGKWLLNLYNRGNLSEDELDEVTPLLNQFTTYRNRIQNKDLNSYKSLDDLSNVLTSVVDDDSMLTDRQKLRFLKNVKSGKVKTSAEDDYNIVLETPKFIVYVPNTHEASMKLGKGTEWCTAHENPDWYNKYTDDNGKLYIVKDKSTGERWQYSDITNDFLDSSDCEFDIAQLMKQDKKLSKFFEKFLEVDYFNFDGTWYYDGSSIPEIIKPSIIKIVISNEITEIIDNAFEGCKNLVSVEIPNTIISIGSRAFSNCNQLHFVEIPESVAHIGVSAFICCKALKSVKLPNGLPYIASYMFDGCTSLRSIQIPNTVTYIGRCAFLGCRRLTYINLPNSIETIYPSAFYGCAGLTSIQIPNNIIKLYDDVFAACRSLETITIPEGITAIQYAAFEDCINLESVYIPKTVKFIDVDAFCNCGRLTIYTNNDYVKDYCKENHINVEPTNRNESFKRYRK